MSLLWEAKPWSTARFGSPVRRLCRDSTSRVQWNTGIRNPWQKPSLASARGEDLSWRPEQTFLTENSVIKAFPEPTKYFWHGGTGCCWRWPGQSFRLRYFSCWMHWSSVCCMCLLDLYMVGQLWQSAFLAWRYCMKLCTDAVATASKKYYSKSCFLVVPFKNLSKCKNLFLNFI